jgi:alkyl sulfatase BDS1-like metallo-beta-lactamase superfamily hydrolase
MIRNIIAFSLLLSAFDAFADEIVKQGNNPSIPKEASQFTKDKNQAVLNELPFYSKKDFDDAKNQFIANTPDLQINNADGRSIMQMADQFGLLKIIIFFLHPKLP